MDAPVIDHALVAQTLRELKYDGWVSLETREAASPTLALGRAVDFLVGAYGGGF